MKTLREYAYRLLRRGEKYTGTDNVYLAKNGFWLTLGQTLASASSLVLAILFGRLVPKEAYGTYQYLIAWGVVLSTASLTGMSDALTQAVARGYERTIFRVVKLRLSCGAIGFAVAAGLALWHFWRGNAVLGVGFLIIGAAFPSYVSLSSWGDYLTGKKEFGLQTRISVLSTLVATALLILAILFLPNPLAFVGAFCVAWTVTNAIAYFYVLKKDPPTGGDDPQVTSYGLKITGIDVLANLAVYLDRLVIFSLLGAAPTAAYAFAIAPVEQLKGYLKNLYFVALPKVSARPLAEIRVKYFRKFWLMTGVIALAIVAYVLLAPFAYAILFPAYPEAVRLTQVYAIGLLGTSAALAAAVFTGHKRVKENVHLQVTTSLIGILLLAVCVTRWGLMGAIIARTATRLFTMGYSIILTKKVFKEA